MSRSDRGTRREHLQRVKNRKKPKPLWFTNGLKLAVVAGVFLVLGAIPYWAVSSGWVSTKLGQANLAWQRHTATAGLTADNIFVNGRIETASADVLLAVDVTKGSPLLAFAPENAKARLENLPWVKEARVERRFPNTIVVNLQERAPIGFFQQNGQLSLVDETGIILAKDGLGRWAGLPVLVGTNAPQRAPELLQHLQEHPDLYRRLKAATLVNERRWTLRLQNNTDVLLPEDNLAQALVRLEGAQQDTRLLEKDVASIDLRLADRMIVTPATPAKPAATTTTKKQGI